MCSSQSLKVGSRKETQNCEAYRLLNRSEHIPLPPGMLFLLRHMDSSYYTTDALEVLLFAYDHRTVDGFERKGYEKATTYALLHMRSLGLVEGNIAHEVIATAGRKLVAAEKTKAAYPQVFSRELIPQTECHRITRPPFHLNRSRG